MICWLKLNDWTTGPLSSPSYFLCIFLIRNISKRTKHPYPTFHFTAFALGNFLGPTVGGALVTALGFTNTTPLLQVDTVPAISISEDLISKNICTPLVSGSLTHILIDCRIVFCRCGVWPSPFLLKYPDVFIRRCGLCWVLLLTWLFWDSLAESLKNTQDSPETQEYTRLSWNTRTPKTPKRSTITILTITWDSIAKSSKWPLCWWRLKSVLVWNKVAGQECYCSFHKESTPCHHL